MNECDSNTIEACKRGRGRPKTFDQEQFLEQAMMEYWRDGVSAISLNEICRRANISKPTIYREFGGEDGMKSAVLGRYDQNYLCGMRKMFENDDLPFDAFLETLSETLLPNSAADSRPAGCLYVDMSAHQNEIGEMAKASVVEARKNLLNSFEKRMQKAKDQGELASDLSPEEAALYIDTQISNIMFHKRVGMSAGELRPVFRRAVSVLTK